MTRPGIEPRSAGPFANTLPDIIYIYIYFISDVLLWTPTYGRAKAGRPARTYIQQLCEDMGCSPEDQPEAMNDREKWRERVRDIRARGTTWWWWWWWWCILETKVIRRIGVTFCVIYLFIFLCKFRPEIITRWKVFVKNNVFFIIWNSW